MWFGPRLTRSQINPKVTAPPESPVMWPWRALWATLLLVPKIPGASRASALCLWGYKVGLYCVPQNSKRRWRTPFEATHQGTFSGSSSLFLRYLSHDRSELRAGGGGGWVGI